MKSNNWTQEAYANYLKSLAQRVSASNPKSNERKPLVSSVRREVPSDPRVKIVFRIFAVRPTDWDACTFKEVQDGLVHAGLLDGDEWNRLECAGIQSEKVYSKKEERTEIQIIYPDKYDAQTN